MEHAWKACVVNATVGSNPTLSAMRGSSSVGRAVRSQRTGRGFESLLLHKTVLGMNYSAVLDGELAVP